MAIVFDDAKADEVSEASAVLGSGADAPYNKGDIVRLTDESRFDNMFAVVVGQRELRESEGSQTTALWLDVLVYCEHNVKHTHTVKVSNVKATGGAV